MADQEGTTAEEVLLYLIAQLVEQLGLSLIHI